MNAHTVLSTSVRGRQRRAWNISETAGVDRVARLQLDPRYVSAGVWPTENVKPAVTR